MANPLVGRRNVAVYDESRNSSRVVPVPPDALPTALRALATLPRDLRRWIEDGAPRLTHDEHRRRFHEPYKGVRARGRKGGGVK